LKGGLKFHVPVPPILYKYYPPQRVDVLDNWTVRFTNPANFNDAFDSNWSAPTPAERIERAKFRNSLGIFCSTTDPDNHLMWVHYAGQHTGFVIGFKSGGAIFSGGELREVQYDTPPPISPPSLELCWYKDNHWSYEKEWRCIRKIGPGEKRDIGLEPEDVSEIILGSAMAGTHVNAVLGCMEWLRDFGVKLCQSKVDLTSRSILHEPSKLALCGACQGKGRVST
jgi:hypothetical protein